VGPPLGITLGTTPLKLSHVASDVAYYELYVSRKEKGTGKEDMPRVKRDPGVATVPRPKAQPKADPLEGLDYTVEKEPNGRWRADCLGITSYGTTKKQALFMLGEELNGFKSEPEVEVGPVEVQKMEAVVKSTVNVFTPTNTHKAESYSIEDAELLWGIEFPSKPELLRQLFLERIQLKDQADRTKARIDEINKALLGFYDRQGVEAIKWEDFTVARVNGSNTTLDKEALVLAGVSAELITQCTKRKEYTTIRVTGPKGGE
jgi:hypothetical protein